MTNLPRWFDIGVLPLVNLALALLATAVVVALVGEDPLEVLAVLLQGAFAPNSLGYTLYYATNFVFTGLAAAIAFQARLFNIGAEGQALLGGLGVALACLSLETALPGLIVTLVAIAGAASFGAAWAAVPGWLQAYRGSHVVITTIMFNFLASGLMVGHSKLKSTMYMTLPTNCALLSTRLLLNTKNGPVKPEVRHHIHTSGEFSQPIVALLDNVSKTSTSL